MGDRDTFDGTTAALRAIVERCSADGDRGGYFPAMYLSVTRTVQRRTAEGRFQNAARMERFVTSFAGRYLDAEAAWRAGKPCTASWHAAFEVSRWWRPIILQHLLLGMNAHINLDLGVAAAALDPAAGIEAIHADFDAINDVLGGLVGGCKAALDDVSPLIGLVDHVAASEDDRLVQFSLVRARQQAWSVATRLAALSGDALAAEIAAVDKATAGVGYVVAHPGRLISTGLLPVRLAERAKPSKVMDLLANVEAGP